MPWRPTAALVLALLFAPAARAAERPNLVVFLVDDLGWQDLSEPFHAERTPWNERYRTPNVERLAREGLKLTDAYSHCVCSPTRVSLMSGWHPARHRVTNWTLREGRAQDGAHPTLDPPAWNVNGLSSAPDTPRAFAPPTLPALLRAAGYRTIHVGKAHFGAAGTPGADPRALGFDVNVAGHAAGAPASYLGADGYAAKEGGDPIWNVPGLERYHERDVFLTEALTREALAELDRAVADEVPFFLYLAHYAVHTPLMPDARFVERYLEAGLDPREARYAAMVEGVDRSLGDVLDRLEHHGVAEDTLVVFWSDNGGLSAVARGGAPHTHNSPLSSGKGSAREGGVRVPAIVRWPGVVAADTRSDVPAIVEDLFPTLLEVAGVEAPEPCDGRSLVPLLRGDGEALRARALFWHYPNVWGPSGPGIGPHSAIRVGGWKLIYMHDGPRTELYDLASDLGETRDLAEEEAERAAALSARLGELLAERGAQMPTRRADGEPVPLPR